MSAGYRLQCKEDILYLKGELEIIKKDL